MSDPRRALVWKAVMEIALVAIGVFLALMADQWRSERQHREQARDALQRFKVEIETNQAAVAKVVEYHATTRTAIAGYLDPKTRDATKLQLAGIQPVVFEHTAWDLALATQSLADIDPPLAFELARLYGMQQMYAGLTGGLMQSMYLRPPSEDLPKFLHSVKIWLDDIVIHEPALAGNYEQILPMIDRALKD